MRSDCKRVPGLCHNSSSCVQRKQLVPKQSAQDVPEKRWYRKRDYRRDDAREARDATRHD